MRIVGQWKVACGLAFASFALAALAPAPVTAPLPDGIAPSGRPPVEGLYAELDFSLTNVTEDLRTFEEDCAKRGVTAQVVERALLDKGKRRIYRSKASVATFEDNPQLDSDPATCTARVSLKRSVELKSGPGQLTNDWTYPVPECPRYYRCQDTAVAGLRAKCVRVGDDFVGSLLCYSREPGLSEGLLLSIQRYSDDGSQPETGWTLQNVTLDARIDPIVFEATAPR